MTVRRRSMWPLPGSSNEYLSTLRGLLRSARDQPSVRVYADRLRKSFPGVHGTADNYIEVLAVVGLIEKRDGRVNLSHEGSRFLRSQQPERVLAELLCTRIDGVGDLLDLLADRPQRVGELHPALADRGFTWRTQSQVRYRLRWLETAGLVERRPARYPLYGLTPRGRTAARRCVVSLVEKRV